MYQIVLTDADTGESFSYPSHHLPSQWTLDYMASIGKKVTVVGASK